MLNSLDAQGTWVIVKRRGDRVRYRNTASGAWTDWERVMRYECPTCGRPQHPGETCAD